MRLEVTNVLRNTDLPCEWAVYEGTDLIATIKDVGAGNYVEMEMFEPFKIQFLGNQPATEPPTDVSKPYAATTVSVDSTRNMLVIQSFWSNLDLV